jgi:hypothetical protein
MGRMVMVDVHVALGQRAFADPTAIFLRDTQRITIRTSDAVLAEQDPIPSRARLPAHVSRSQVVLAVFLTLLCPRAFGVRLSLGTTLEATPL